MTNKRSQQENITDERGITEVLESGIFQASFAVSRFRYANGFVTPIAPPGAHKPLHTLAVSLVLVTCPLASGLQRAPWWQDTVCILHTLSPWLPVTQRYQYHIRSNCEVVLRARCGCGAVGFADANSEGSRSLCVPDNSSYEAIVAKQYAADAPATASAGVNVVGVAVGVSVAAVALIAAALTTAAVLMRRARRRRAAVECDKDSLPRGTLVRAPPCCPACMLAHCLTWTQAASCQHRTAKPRGATLGAPAQGC